MMNRRVLLTVLGLVVLSTAILYMVSVWLPARGVMQPGPELSVRPLLAPAANHILVLPANRGVRPFLGLRPFGLHREGLPGVLWHIGSFVSLLIMAALAFVFAPRRVGVLSGVVSNGWGQRLLAFMIGLLGYLGLALLGFLIFINVVGWPIMVVLSLAVYFATAYGLVAVSLAVGSWLCRSVGIEQSGALFRLGVGVLVLFLCSIIPYVGWFVAGLSAVLGFGAVLWTRGGGATGWTLDDGDA
jgi:hypothetical protein